MAREHLVDARMKITHLIGGGGQLAFRSKLFIKYTKSLQKP